MVATQDPLILAIETSARIGSVAIARGARLCAEAVFQADFNHAVELLPTIDRLCRDCTIRSGDLQHIYLSTGPGSFTGLRIAVTLARTMARAGGQRLVAVPTLHVLAQNALAHDPPPQRVSVLLDAKRRQVYAATFRLEAEGYEPEGAAAVVDPRAFLEAQPLPRAVLGEGLRYHREALNGLPCTPLSEALWQPHAAVVHRLGRAMALAGQYADPATLTPVYLRLPEAEEVWRKRQNPGN